MKIETYKTQHSLKAAACYNTLTQTEAVQTAAWLHAYTRGLPFAPRQYPVALDSLLLILLHSQTRSVDP